MPDLDLFLILNHFLKIAAAFVLALPIAWEREESTRIMGMRTFPLVALASCGFVLLGIKITGADGEAQARILQGLMSGIGFIGGGAILKEGNSVRGTATAVSIWTTGAIGAAVAHGRYEIAIILSLVNFLTLKLIKSNHSQSHSKK
jgi:putative Mg2+ transporter-C (MgtC) family protein